MRPDGFRALVVGAACSLLAATATAHAMDLSAAVRKAQAFDPTTQAAQYAYLAGQEKGRQGMALYFPQVNATANYSRVHINSVSTLTLPPGFPTPVLVGDTSGSLYGFGVTLVQPIYNAAVFAGAAELKDQARLAGVQKQGADVNLILRVAQAYFGVLMAGNSVELAHEQQAAIAQQLAGAQARFKAGKTNITDVRDAEARDQGIGAQLIAAENNLAVQRATFTSIVGAPPVALADVPETFRPIPPQPDDLKTWMDWAHKDNLNVQGARIQIDVNEHEVAKYRLRSRPQVNLVASYQDVRQSGSLPILVAPDHSQQAVVGVQLSVPLFAGGSYGSKYREAVDTETQSRYQLQATLESTGVQVQQQFLNVQVGVDQIAALQKAVVAAKSSLDATTLGLKVGKKTTLDVLNAQQQYFSAQQNLDAARYQYLLARLSLAALVDRLGPDDVNAVNAYLTSDGTTMGSNPAPTAGSGTVPGRGSNTSAVPDQEQIQ